MVAWEQDVEVIVAGALPSEEQQPSLLCERRARLCGIAEGNLVREPGDVRVRRIGPDIDGGDVEVLVPRALPGGCRGCRHRRRARGVRGGLARDVFAPEARTLVGGDDDVQVLVPGAPEREVEIAVMRGESPG